ncbi:MAG: hypothetical protein AB7O59_19980 [Pirellulales bacterium]
MRSDYGKLLRKQFEEVLLRTLPQFERSSETENLQGCRLYESRLTPALVGYIFLIVSIHSEWFTIELGWSHDGRFPSWLIPVRGPERGAYRLRIAELWHATKDHWWKVTAQRTVRDMTLEEIGRFDMDFLNPPPKMTDADREVLRTAVDDAIQKIQQYAIPYFEQVAQEYGSGPAPQTS